MTTPTLEEPARACFFCRESIAECMGFVHSGDVFDLLNSNRMDFPREFCQPCAHKFSVLSSTALRAGEAAMRERCAEVAEEQTVDPPVGNQILPLRRDRYADGHEIAAAIRALPLGGDDAT